MGLLLVKLTAFAKTNKGSNFSIIRSIIYIAEKDFNPKELQMGIKVEMEHLNDKSPYVTHLAKRISLDHLAELPDYYSKLKEVEA